ncbi:hypothetical protein REPUB_Repub01dG0021200 [Reevesia pubescens]
MVFGTIIKNGFDEDFVIQTSPLCLYGEMGILSYAKKVLDEMPIRDLVSWSSIILSYIENGKSNEGLEMFRLMVLEGIRPDSVTMLSVAEACGELGLFKFARLVHGYIVRRTIESDGSLANSLVKMYSKCGDLGSTERIYLNVTNRGTASWTAMISSYNRSGLGRLKEGKSVHCYIIGKEMDPEYDVVGPVLIELNLKCGKLNYCENVLHIVGGSIVRKGC